MLFVSEFTLLSNFLISSSGGTFLGTIFCLTVIFLLLNYFLICSEEILLSEDKPLSFKLKTVITLAKSFAFITIVGRKSAQGRLSGTPNFFFICKVFFLQIKLGVLLLLISPKLLSNELKVIFSLFSTPNF